jgi:hypothetical protein
VKRNITAVFVRVATRAAVVFAAMTAMLFLANMAGADLAFTTRELEAQGIGIIINNRTVAARESAINDALRKTVEATISSFISSELMVENYQQLNTEIYSNINSYVRSFRLKGEEQSGNLYKVTVSAEISMEKIRAVLEKMGVIKQKFGKPRLLIVVSQKKIEENAWSSWLDSPRPAGTTEPVPPVFNASESALMEKLSALGYSLAIPDVAIKMPEEGKLSETYFLPLARELGAEVIILGRSSTSLYGRMRDSDIKGMKAETTARAINVSDGSFVTEATAHASTLITEEPDTESTCFRRAAGILSEKLSEGILSNWKRSETEVSKLDILINGYSSYEDFSNFQKFLRNKVDGVHNIQIVSVSPLLKVLRLEFAGNARLARERMESGNEFAEVRVTIGTVTDRSIEVTLGRGSP